MPGTSGVLSPFGKIDGLYFNNSREPDDYLYEFKKDLSKLMDEEGVEYIELQVEDKVAYYKLLDQLADFNKECIVVNGTSRKDKYTVIVENQEDQSDDSEDTVEGEIDE